MLKSLKSANTAKKCLIANGKDVHFLMYIFQGTDATVGDSFAPLAEAEAEGGENLKKNPIIPQNKAVMVCIKIRIF